MAAIKICNPQPGQAKYTTEARAADYVKSGVAELLPGNLLYFLPNPNSIRYATAGVGGLAREAEIRRIPVVGDVMRLFRLTTNGPRRQIDPARSRAIDRILEKQRKVRVARQALAEAARFSLRNKTSHNGGSVVTA